MRFGLDENIIEKISEVLEKQPKVDKAFIFGSRAKGNYRPDSDIDIAVKGYDINMEDILKMSLELEKKKIGYEIDLVDYNSIKEDALKEHVDRVGVEAYRKWKEYKLSELCSDIMYGYTASANDMPVGPKFLRITDIVPQRVDWENVPYCEIGENDHKKYKLEKGDILIARTGATTGYNYVFNDNVDAVFASYLIKYKINEKMANPFFIGYVLKSNSWKGFVEGIMGGSAQPGANAKMFAGFTIALPSLSEQEAITELLSNIDSKINLLHRQNRTLELIAEGLFRQWFEEKAGTDWKIGTLADEFEFTMGQSPAGETLNELKIGMVFYQGRTDFSFRFPIPRVYTTSPNRVAQARDTLISVRAPVGDMNMAIEECCLGRGVAAFRYIRNSSFFSYTYYKLRSLMILIKQFEDKGSVFGSIGKDDFKGIENIIPPYDYIDKFQEEVGPIDEKIISNHSQIDKLTQMRDMLLPKLMNGEARMNLK